MSMSVALPGFVFAPAGRVPAVRALPGCAPGGAVTFFCFAKRKSPKKRRPHFAGRPRADFSALLGSAGKPTNSPRVRDSNMWASFSVRPCAARRLRRGPQRVARCASIPSTGRRGAIRALGCAVLHSLAALTPNSVRTEESKCHANPSLPQGERDECSPDARDSMPAQQATLAGPRLSRRAAQGWTDQKGRLSEHAQRASLSPFPARPSSAEQLALGQPAQWGRLFFREFLLAKQKKVTAPPGAHPGNGRQAASPRKGETEHKQRQTK
jgi:hypothetical protein